MKRRLASHPGAGKGSKGRLCWQHLVEVLEILHISTICSDLAQKILTSITAFNYALSLVVDRTTFPPCLVDITKERYLSEISRGRLAKCFAILPVSRPQPGRKMPTKSHDDCSHLVAGCLMRNTHGEV